jgi:hypothetical protein
VKFPTICSSANFDAIERSMREPLGKTLAWAEREVEDSMRN